MPALALKTARVLERYAQGMAESFAIGAMDAAVKAAPGPEKTTTATGRARMSIRTASRERAYYDPGKGLGSYSTPDASVALRGIEDRAPYDAVVLDMGVPYAVAVEIRWGYASMEAGARGGRAAIRNDHSENWREAVEG